MNTDNFYTDFFTPISGRKKAQLIAFLAKSGLDFDESVSATVCIYDEDTNIAATCSISENVLKCIAVSDECRGLGLSGQIISLMTDYAYSKGIRHLFLFTKPKNAKMFADVGFYPIIKTEDILFMENNKNGICSYIDGLSRCDGDKIGCVVMNCNPFTLGHLYLVQTAAAQCDCLHIFVLSEDKSRFSAADRYELVKKGTAQIKNVLVHKTSDYLISSAVFPTYFMKDKAKAEDANCLLDLKIFCEYFAKKLNISIRFVGSEPFCPVTNSYNQKMQEILPQYNIKVVEIPRKTDDDGLEISASRVRALLDEGNFDEIKKLVPLTTYDYLINLK